MSKTATFRISQEKWEAFTEKAKANGSNASEVLKHFIDSYLSGDIVSTRIDNSNIESNESIDNHINERMDKATSAIESDLKRLVEDEMTRLHKDWNNRLLALEEQMTAKKTTAPESKNQSNLGQNHSFLNMGRKQAEETASELEEMQQQVEAVERWLSARALAKRLKTDHGTIAKHRKRGEEHFKSWSSSRDPENIEWCYIDSEKIYKPLKQ